MKIRQRIVAFLAMLAGAGGLNAQTYRVLKSFDGASDGGHPRSVLVEAGDGNLYGTTSTNGAFGGGTLFKLSKDGTAFSVLHDFGGPGDGSNAAAGLIVGTNGALYGTTCAGGGANSYGTVFKILTNGTDYSVTHSFIRDTSAVPEPPESPQAGLFLASDGMLYGTASGGGSIQGGAVFKLDHGGGGFAMIHAFTGLGFGPGDQPKARVVEGTNGALYGTTWIGPTGGTVFKLDKDGNNYVDLHQFSTSGTDGANPLAELLVASDGFLYGATSSGAGGGAVFKMSHDGSVFSTLHNFTGGSDGLSPQGGLVEGSDGFLYGTTAGNGTSLFGTIFKISKDGAAFTTLHQFTGSAGDGSGPKANLIFGSDGNLYGTTDSGGANGAGTIFVVYLASLKVQVTGNQILLSWPQQSSAAVLETTPTLDADAQWTTVPTSGNSASVPLASGSQFFRLRIPIQ